MGIERLRCTVSYLIYSLLFWRFFVLYSIYGIHRSKLLLLVNLVIVSSYEIIEFVDVVHADILQFINLFSGHLNGLDRECRLVGKFALHELEVFVNFFATPADEQRGEVAL